LPRPRGLTQKDKRKLQKFVTKAMRFYDLTRTDVASGEFHRPSKSRSRGPKADRAYHLSVLNRLFTDRDNLSCDAAHAIGIMLLSCPGADAWRRERKCLSFAESREAQAERAHEHEYQYDVILNSLADKPKLWWFDIVQDVFPSLQYLNAASSDIVYFPPMLLPFDSINRCARWIEHESRKQGRKKNGAKSTFAERLAREADDSGLEVADVLSDRIAMRLVGINLPNPRYVHAGFEHHLDSAGKEIPPDLYRKYNDTKNLINKTVLEFQRGSES